jgi:flagellar hook-length control protein FliK
MNALERTDLLLPAAWGDTSVTPGVGGVGASGLGGLASRGAGSGAGSIAQQQAGLSSNGQAQALLAGAYASSTTALPSTLATVSVDARLLESLSHTEIDTPLITADKPLCPVAPNDGRMQAASATAAADNTHAPAASPAFTALLAKALVQSLEGSGLFYESHLAEWANGQRSMESLDREPQSRFAPMNLPTPALPNPAAGALSGNATNGFAASLPGVSEFLTLIRDAFTGDDASAANTANANGAGQTASPIHPDLMPTVRQQLELLQNPLLRWSGEAWPGAKMDWEIERRDENNTRSGTESPVDPAWRMHVRLDLPRLGPVDVELNLQGPRLTTKLKASPDSAASFLHESDQLRARIASTGLELKGFTVREMMAQEHATDRRGDA